MPEAATHNGSFHCTFRIHFSLATFASPQVKGKAAIDVVCNPMGKSGGAAIQQVLIIVFGSLANSTPYLGVILLGIVSLWIVAARSLDSQFKPMVHKGIKTQLSEGKLEALSARLLGRSRGRQVSATCLTANVDFL